MAYLPYASTVPLSSGYVKYNIVLILLLEQRLLMLALLFICGGALGFICAFGIFA